MRSPGFVVGGVDLGPVQDASGVRGFLGDGYWWHGRFARAVGLDLTRSSFVSKTFTLNPHPGNMPLDADVRPVSRFPDCVVTRPLAGAVLNAVGLCNPGAHALMVRGVWQRMTRPFQLSIAVVNQLSWPGPGEQAQMITALVNRDVFLAPVVFQVNASCANTAARPSIDFSMYAQICSELAALHGAATLKVSIAHDPLEVLRAVTTGRPGLSRRGVVVSNAIPWRSFGDEIDWGEMFGERSPLERYGGGALSGRPLLPLVERWVRRFRALSGSSDVPLCAGGGVMRVDDVDRLADAGADAIFVGSVAMLRPWRVRSIVDRAWKLLGH